MNRQQRRRNVKQIELNSRSVREVTEAFNNLCNNLQDTIDLMNSMGVELPYRDKMVKKYIGQDKATNKHFLNIDILRKDYFDMNNKELGIYR